MIENDISNPFGVHYLREILFVVGIKFKCTFFGSILKIKKNGTSNPFVEHNSLEVLVCTKKPQQPSRSLLSMQLAMMMQLHSRNSQEKHFDN